jgi:hypothetical protein
MQRSERKKRATALARPGAKETREWRSSGSSGRMRWCCGDALQLSVVVCQGSLQGACCCSTNCANDVVLQAFLYRLCAKMMSPEWDQMCNMNVYNDFMAGWLRQGKGPFELACRATQSQHSGQETKPHGNHFKGTYPHCWACESFIILHSTFKVSHSSTRCFSKHELGTAACSPGLSHQAMDEVTFMRCKSSQR